MIIILGFDYCDRDIGLIEQHIISTLVFSTGMQLPTHKDTPISQGKFFANLRSDIPASQGNRIKK
jgi:hypothetical protein